MTATQAKSGPSRRRGPYAATAARRDQIIDAALAAFAEHGYDRASLRDIAARAGITHAAILRHFSGKDELLLAALAKREAADEEFARRIIDSSVPGPAVLGAVLKDEFADPSYERHWLALSVAATDPDHPAHAFFVDRRKRLRQWFGTGPLPIGHGGAQLTADQKVTLILGMMDGLRHQTLLEPSVDALEPLNAFMTWIMGAGEPTE